MHAPQVVMICWLALGCGIALAKNGQPKEGNWSFGWAVVAVIIHSAIMWWGGFWK